MNIELERVLLQNIFCNTDYAALVCNHIEPQYFFDEAHRVVFGLFSTFYSEHGRTPSLEIMLVEIEGAKMNGELFNKSRSVLIDLFKEPERRPDHEWLVNTTDTWIRNMAVYNAVLESVKIIDGKDKRTVSALPGLMTDAVSKGINFKLGTDYFGDAMDRIKALTQPQYRMPLLLDYMNKILNGGWKQKSLNVLLAGTGGGKTLGMCSFASDDLRQGRVVLYVSAEMSEEEIAYRIDANLLNMPINSLDRFGEMNYLDHLEGMRDKWKSNLFIKEYPEHTASANDVRNLVRDMELKLRCKPDIIYLDYVNIFTSSRTNMKLSGGSYGYVKSICEEFRALSKELSIPIITATQVNRSGYNSNDVDLTEISESFGIAMSADLVLAIISTEEFRKDGKMMLKQLKSRYGNKSNIHKFIVGVDYDRQRLYNVSNDDMQPMDLIEVPDPLLDAIQMKIDHGDEREPNIEDLFI